MTLTQIFKPIKSVSILTVLAVCLAFTSADARKLSGQIVDRSGDIREVTFNIPFRFLSSTPNFESMQFRIVYFDDSGQRQVLKPDDAREISFTFNNHEIRMISTPNSLMAGSIFSSSANIFLHLITDGRLKLFKYYYTQNNPGMYGAGGSMGVGYSYSSDNYVLQLDGKDLMQPRGLSFRKDMLEYLADCPHVARMIESRDLKRRDTEIIVQIYNDNCAD